VLNFFKYVVYFGALGFVLTEFGVNYTTYFASLSVIGLAVGFGSQGLVQDIVTGFFIIFENQFDVGDMVEIPPYTGVVEELGLRVTRLRNYLGQNVVIPNRNIAAVGNYLKGAQEVYVDVAATGPETAAREREILKKIGEELARQYEGVIRASPIVLMPVSLESSENFARMHLKIWPQQQWVVEQQLVSRLREAFKSEDIEIPGDRISVFYHQRKELSVRSSRRNKRKTVDS